MAQRNVFLLNHILKDIINLIYNDIKINVLHRQMKFQILLVKVFIIIVMSINIFKLYVINSNYEYIYKFDNAAQYLKSCEETIMYTTSESKTYLYNNTCYLEYPKNIVKNESTKICDCLYYKYNVDDNNCICYSKEEKCLDKIHIIELKICLDDIKGCKDKKYKIFNNDCFFKSVQIIQK